MKLPNFQILNSKQTRGFYKILKEEFGYTGKIDRVFVQNKEKIYLVTRAIGKIDFNKLRINSIGLYVAKKEPFGLRLSVEGSQIFGPSCTKNIHIVDDPTQWMKGQDIETEKEYEKIVIVKHKKDFLGSGLYKSGKIQNFIPKSRRIRD